MSIGTFFLRNRPQLECMCRLLSNYQSGCVVNITVLGCSKGAEVYSIAFVIRCARPDLEVVINALDVSKEVVQFAQAGIYSRKGLGRRSWPNPSLIAEKGELAWNTWKGQDTSVFERLSSAEMEEMFDLDQDQARVKARFREGIIWQVADAADPRLTNCLGYQDIVVASNFLCHLSPEQAEDCLRKMGKLVKPGGYLFVSGVDLDVRTKVALDLNWHPVTDLIREIHEGDPSVTSVWPWNYCGLEPFDSNRKDWETRYASAFRLGTKPGAVRN